MQFQTVFLLPRHDRQLGGHGLEAVPGALVLGVGLVLTEKDEKGKGAMLREKKNQKSYYGLNVGKMDCKKLLSCLTCFRSKLRFEKNTATEVAAKSLDNFQN